MSEQAKTQVKNQGTDQSRPTGVLVLANGQCFYGHGAGAQGAAVGEVCFNTAMTGYQEILTDPSYAQQIILFTFPHIGNVGTNGEDEEAATPKAQRAARGAIFRQPITAPSNYRAQGSLNDWLEARGIVGLSGIDTRALTAHIRDHGMPHGVVAHNQDGKFDIPALQAQACAWAGLEGADLAGPISTENPYPWREGGWRWPDGFGARTPDTNSKKVVLIDYGTKRNILRCLVDQGLDVTVVGAHMPAKDILTLEPDGIVLSNGPGDPAATGAYAIPTIQALIAAGLPVFGICLGHQLLALALGARTVKMAQGHHGANHPVMDFETGKVEIVSMNHGFAADPDSFPEGVVETHKSLFDGSNCGLKLTSHPVFSVQYHPEASPGPRDSFYLFDRFTALL